MALKRKRKDRVVTLDEAARIVRDTRRTAVQHGPPTVALAWAVWLVLPYPPAIFLVGSGLITLSWLGTVGLWLQGSWQLKRRQKLEQLRYAGATVESSEVN